MIALALAAAATTTSVGVQLDEYRLGLGRTHVKSGYMKLNVANLGEDPHDVAVRRNADGRIVGQLSPLAPGSRGTLKVKVSRAGVYTLFCTLGDHADRGMLARVRVSNKR